MFISTGQKGDIKTIKPLKPRQNITCEGGVGMPNMRLVIHVINGGGDIIRLCHLRYPTVRR